MAGADKKKKIAVAGLASILLVAMCVAVAVGVTRKGGSGDVGSSGNTASGSGGSSIGASTRAVQAICAPTDYKETCEKSLSHANTTDPKELIKVAFNVAVENIGNVLKQSTLLKEAANDPSTKDAYSVCEEVLEDAVEDLKRSVDKVGEFNVSKVNEYIEDVKTWLSAVITYQETCIDAFENVTGDNGEKMKNLLHTARELSSNGLAMATELSSIFSSLELGNLGSRRLLSEEGRELYFKDPTDYAPGEEPHYVNKARRLLSAWRPNAVVAQDGSGQFRKINDAIAKVPKKNKNTFVIYVKAGLYKENVIVPKGAHKIVLIGDGPMKTRITGNKCFAKGTKTFQSATVAINADDFVAKNIAFENTAGPEGHQAVALRVSGDRAVFFNVHIDGYQDSLYAHTYRQYYRDCSISGTIDFIFGDALSIFQNCKFIVRKPMKNQACMVTAQGRVDPRSQGAIVIQNGDILAEPAFLATKPAIKAYLGRPWKQLSRTIIMQSNIGGFIAPEGWSPWMGDFALDTLYYAEFQNRGPGSDLRRRVHWKGIRHINGHIANSFTGGRAFGGDYWIRAAGVPYVPTLMRV